MKEDWPELPSPVESASSDSPVTREGDQVDEFDTLLADYERRKQEEARNLIQRALQLEHARSKGADLLRTHVLSHARDVAGRLRKAGHRVLYRELLESYPPNVRLHLYPKAGPMDLSEPTRWTLELTWGEPEPDRLVAQRWTSAGLGEMVELGSVEASEIDQLWVREQFLHFVRRALDLK